MLSTPSSVSVEGIRFQFADTHNSWFGEAEERKIRLAYHSTSDSRIKRNTKTLVHKDEPEMPPPCFEHTHTHTHDILSVLYCVCGL